MNTQRVEHHTPQTTADLAAALRDAGERGQAVVPWGAGTLQHLGGPPPEGALVLYTAALDRVLEYNPADLTITVEAGAALGALQAMLGERGQWLPWHPPTPATATIGGLLAAGAGGPLRLGYGTPRDWVLGMRVALADGRLVKSGGKVVKNVAGYETHKLHIGALGTLGVIVEVTFKVAPLPERVGMLALACPTRAGAFALAERLREPPLAPISLVLLNHAAAPDLAWHPSTQQGQALVVARFAGVPAVVERQLLAATGATVAAGAALLDLDGAGSDALWQDLVSFAAPGPLPEPPHEQKAPALLVRAGARPSELLAVMEALERHAPLEAPTAIVGYGGVGLAYARWPLPPGLDAVALAHSVAALRSALAGVGGYAVIEEAPAPLRHRLDLWGPAPESLALMRSLKTQWDPRNVLNPGRYIV